MNGDAMAIVRFRRDEIPPPTPEEEAHYRALAERPDSEIEYSDIPGWRVDPHMIPFLIQNCLHAILN